MIGTTQAAADSPDESPVYVSIAEVAKHLGFGESTVRHWCTDKKIPSVKVGGRIRIPKTVLDPKNWKDGKFVG